MPPRRFSVLIALFAPLLIPLAASGAIEPRLLRYFTEAEILEHDAYRVPLYALSVWNLLAPTLFLTVFLALGFNARLLARCDRWAARLGPLLARSRALRQVGQALSLLWGDASWGGAMLFVPAFFAVLDVVALPIAFYFGFVYEHRHGVGVQSMARWFYDFFKAESLSVAAHACLAFGLYGLARRKERWWLWLGVPCSILMLGAGVLDPYRIQVIHDYQPLPAGPARERISATLRAARVEYQEVALLKMRELTKRVDAFVVGQGPSRRVVLYDTLVKAMSPEEVANAVAHELGHVGERGMGRIALASAALLPGLWALSRVLRWMGRTGRFGFRSDREVASLPAMYLAFGLAMIAVTPVSSAYSRHLERRADEYALELLRQPEAFRSMMIKLVKLNLGDVHPPLYSQILSGHPVAMERVERAESFARERGLAMAEPTPELFQVPEGCLPRKKNELSGFDAVRSGL